MSEPIAVRAALAVLARLAPADAREEIVGDLREEWAEVVVPERGEAAARAWLVRQALASAPPLVALRWRRGELRSPLTSAAAAIVASGAVVAAWSAAWHALLTLVPLRASHAPPLGWVVALVVFVAVAAVTAAKATARFLESSRRMTS